MARGDVCGSQYEKTLSIDAWGRRHTFDCFESASHLLAPTCDHCGWVGSSATASRTRAAACSAAPSAPARWVANVRA
jgi:hypothetical protein